MRFQVNMFWLQMTQKMFAKAVIQLIDDKELRDRIAGNGRRLVEEIYDQQVVLKKLEQIYPVSKGA